tara:strand:- start:88 stop:1800 length:1713 start_codon:yes stop_codon:yes gene_type:complete
LSGEPSAATPTASSATASRQLSLGSASVFASGEGASRSPAVAPLVFADERKPKAGPSKLSKPPQPKAAPAAALDPKDIDVATRRKAAVMLLEALPTGWMPRSAALNDEEARESTIEVLVRNGGLRGDSNKVARLTIKDALEWRWSLDPKRKDQVPVWVRKGDDGAPSSSLLAPRDAPAFRDWLLAQGRNGSRAQKVLITFGYLTDLADDPNVAFARVAERVVREGPKPHARSFVKASSLAELAWTLAIGTPRRGIDGYDSYSPDDVMGLVADEASRPVSPLVYHAAVSFALLASGQRGGSIFRGTWVANTPDVQGAADDVRSLSGCSEFEVFSILNEGADKSASVGVVHAFPVVEIGGVDMRAVFRKVAGEREGKTVSAQFVPEKGRPNDPSHASGWVGGSLAKAPPWQQASYLDKMRKAGDLALSAAAAVPIAELSALEETGGHQYRHLIELLVALDWPEAQCNWVSDHAGAAVAGAATTGAANRNKRKRPGTAIAVYAARYNQRQHLWARLRFQLALRAMLACVGGFDGIDSDESWESVVARAKSNGFVANDSRWAPASSAQCRELAR